MWSHSGPSGAGRVAQAAGVKTLVLTHLGPYTRATRRRHGLDVLWPSPRRHGPRRGPDIWDKIVDDARKQFGGTVILGRDAKVIEIG